MLAVLVPFSAVPTDSGWTTTKTNAGNSFTAASAFPRYDQAVLADAPSAYYRLSDTAGGTTMADSSGNGRTGAYSVTTSSTSFNRRAGAPVGGFAAAFNATNLDTVVQPVATTPSGSAGTTASMEVWLNTTASIQTLVSLGSAFKQNSSSVHRLLAIQSDGRLVFGITFSAGRKIVTSNNAVNDGAWHHVVATYGSGTMNLYVDGVAQTPTTGTGAPSSYGTAYWRIGGDNASGTGWGGLGTYYTGVLDEFAVYPTVLSAARVAAHYAAGSGYAAAVAADSPWFYWRLDDAEGQTAADAGPNAFPGEYRIDPQARAGTTGALTGPVTSTNNAVRFAGYTGHGAGPSATVSGPNTVEAWFRTTTAYGGVLVGLGAQSTCGSVARDRTLWLTDSGTVRWGVFPSGASTPYPSIGTITAYNDGAWHHVVGSIGPTYGMRLFVDGSLLASNSAVTTGYSGTGYWCVGFSQTDNYGAAYTPSYQHVAATLDEVAIYPTELSPQRIALHYYAVSR